MAVGVVLSITLRTIVCDVDGMPVVGVMTDSHYGSQAKIERVDAEERGVRREERGI